jgi:hypothetical protein
MRIRHILIPLLLFLWTCDWQPDEIQIESRASFENYNLVVGDTLTIQVEGSDFSQIEGLDETIAEVVDLLADGKTLQIIALSIGELKLFFRYTPPLTSGEEIMTASYAIRINVTESIPLFIDVGESQSLDVSNYLTNEQLIAIDSLAIVSGGMSPLNRITLEPVDGETTQFSLTGVAPGTTMFQVEYYDVNRIRIITLYYQVTVSIHKLVFAELFTNTGCVNCPEANGYLDDISHEFGEDFVIVRYHVNWTDPFDPMNLYNPGEVESRRAYYNIIAAPGLVIDGTHVSTLDLDDWSGRVSNASLTIPTAYISEIDVMESIDSLYLDFDLNPFGTPLSDLLVWSVVVEDSIEYAGSNGEDLHMNVMRDMSFTSVGNLEELTTFQHSLKKPDDYGMAGPMGLIVFIQAQSSKSVIQARKQALY